MNISMPLCVSTLEHVGMDNMSLWDDEIKKNALEAYLQAVGELRV